MLPLDTGHSHPLTWLSFPVMHPGITHLTLSTKYYACWEIPWNGLCPKENLMFTYLSAWAGVHICILLEPNRPTEVLHRGEEGVTSYPLSLPAQLPLWARYWCIARHQTGHKYQTFQKVNGEGWWKRHFPRRHIPGHGSGSQPAKEVQVSVIYYLYQRQSSWPSNSSLTTLPSELAS